jgi:uncharacterized protein YjbJ (UPF0337 family)
MNKLLAKSYWNVAKGKLKQNLARLTGDSLEFNDGKRDELVGRIQKRTAKGVETGPDTCSATACKRQTR